MRLCLSLPGKRSKTYDDRNGEGSDLKRGLMHERASWTVDDLKYSFLTVEV